MTLPNLKAITASALLLLPLAMQAEPAKFVVDEEHFSMSFEIMHVGYAPVMGMFRDVEGQFEYDEETGELSSGKLMFKAASVFTNHEKRDDHVRNKDFLWGMTYGTDNGMVGDEVTLRFGFEAIKDSGWF
ncbi:YceI family protein [Marinobacter vinifirmus]|uniref:Lipid/polyisoprenoid-binding YceI-like domain-containing protein n=1 Tax=Marinobacter vinifirmus TaxID=355591 RepID=A0A558B4H3_9GAMM|nr:YceI family protein [Marinobacter vinifirmus]TVT31406.1 MAG: hypothetical protein FHK81_15090 [Marinobacter vinifirmus]